MRRVPELIDVWFDSGAMPYAQWGYPQSNRQEFEDQFPADYICEAIDQTRGWFYSLHAIGTLYKNSNVFKNLVIHPASTTHFRMDDAALAGAGITQGTIRLSIGLEEADDLIDDLKRALKAAEKAAA